MEINHNRPEDVLTLTALADPDAPAIVSLPSREVITYGELAAGAQELSRWMIGSLGVSRDDLVGLCLPNSADFVKALFGVWYARAVPTYLTWRLSEPEISQLVQLCGLDAVVTSPERVDELAHALDGQAWCGVLRSNVDPSVVAERAERRASLARADVLARVPYGSGLVRFTSGTTGLPKGVVVSAEGWLRRAADMLRTTAVVQRGSSTLQVGPLTHASGLWLLPTMMVGGCLVLLDRFDEDLVADACDEFHPAQVTMVPTMLRRLLDNDRAAAAIERCGTQIGYGGAPSTRALIEEAIARFGYRLSAGYGSHELGSISSLSVQDHRVPERLMSVGRPTIGVRVRVGEGDQREGIIRASTPWMSTAMLRDGLWQRPEEEFLETGDVGRIDDNGYLYIIDRIDGLLITGGFNVYTKEVEEALTSHPDVKESAVFGEPDREWGDRIVAAVVPAANQHADEAELIRHCHKLVAGYKCPKEIIFLDELPLNANGKVHRKGLQEIYEKRQSEAG